MKHCNKEIPPENEIGRLKIKALARLDVEFVMSNCGECGSSVCDTVGEDAEIAKRYIRLKLHHANNSE